MAVLQHIWLYEIIGGTVRVVTDVSKYHNAGTMEHRLKDIVFYVKKQSVSIGLGNGLMLHRRPAITWANCDQVYQRIYESSNLNVLIWWKCMVSYCRYHNGRTFIISCWRAWKVYANYICYILGRSLSCLIFCNYDSPQNWTWRMWSYILSVNIVFKHPTKLHHSRQTSYMETRSKLYGKLYAVYLKMW